MSVVKIMGSTMIVLHIAIIASIPPNPAFNRAV